MEGRNEEMLALINSTLEKLWFLSDESFLSMENGRVSVLKKLRQKQAEIAKRGGKPAQQMEVTEDMERRRK